MTSERFRSEEAVREWPGFSRDHRQNGIVLKCYPDQVVRYRCGKQPPGSFPERIDIRRPMQAEQRSLDYGIDDRFALHIRRHLGAFCFRMRTLQPFACPNLRPRAQKYNRSYLAAGTRRGFLF